MMLWDVVSGLHDNGWLEDDLPRAIPRLWKNSMVETKLANLSSLSLPEDFMGADTIPTELTRMGACQLLAFSGVDGGTSRYEGARWLYMALSDTALVSV